MQNLTNVRRKAQKLAQKGATHEALAEYAKLAEGGQLEPYDLVVYGDLLGRSGNRAESVKRYIEAMESYSRAGLNRNAIALGKKVRRLSPEATHVHKTLGELYAAEGLASESCLHFLEYLENADSADKRTPDLVEEACSKLLELSLPSFQVVPKIVQAAKKVGREKKLAEGIVHQIRRAAAVSNQEAENNLREILAGIDPEAASSVGALPAGDVDESSSGDSSRMTIGVGDIPEAGYSLPAEDETEAGMPREAAPVAAEDPAVLSLDDFTFEEQEETPREAGAPNPLGNLLEDGDSSGANELPAPEESEPEPVAGEAPVAAGDSGTLEGDPDEICEQGMRALERNDPVRAQHAFMKAASLYFEAAQSRSAAELYERVVKMDPNHLDALRGLVEIAHINGEKRKMAHWGCELGDVLLAREMHADAKVQFERVLAFDPQNTKAQARLRRLNTMAGVKEAGFGELAPSASEVQGAQVVIRDEESDTTSQSSINLSQILDEFRASVVQHIPTGDSQSHYDLGMTYKEMGLLEEALREFEAAAGGDENRPGSLEMMGECYLLLSRVEEAVATLEQLVAETNGGGGAPVHLRLGRAYEALGDWDRAEEEYHRALEIDENLEEAVELLQSLEIRRTQGAA